MSVFPRNALFLFDFFEILWYNIYTKMRGENKMIDVSFVNKLIDGVVNRFRKNGYLRRHYYEIGCVEGEPFEIHFYIEDELSTALSALNLTNDVVLIKQGDDRWLVRVWYKVNDELQMRNFMVYGDM